MNYKIIEKAPIKIVGKELRVRNDNGDNYRLIPEFWAACNEDETMQCLAAMPNIVNPNVCLGVCMDFDGINTFTYLICSEVNNFDFIPEGMVGKDIPASKYAVFTAKGKCPEAIQQTFKDIYQKWFPESGCERTDGPDFEYYDERCMVNDENCEVDIYIPIK